MSCLSSPVLSVLVKYKSMLRSINRTFATNSKASFTLPSKLNRRNITDSISEPPSVSRTPDMILTNTVMSIAFNTTHCTLYI